MAWFLWAFFLAWGLGLCAVLHRFLADSDQAAFLREGQALLRHCALGLADVLGTEREPLAGISLQRLAGEPRSRYAVLMDRKGVVRFAAGSPPPPAWEERLAGRALAATDFLALEAPDFPPFVEWVQPVWVRSRKWGVLRWGVWTEELQEERMRHGKRLLLAWAWAALVGGVAVCLFVRKDPPGA